MKKLLSLALILVISLSASIISVSAETTNDDYGIMPYYAYTTTLNSDLSISSKTATCKSVIVGSPGVTKIVVTQKLQKKVSGEWTNVKTWTKTYTTATASFTNTKSSLSAGTYRTRTVAKIYNGSAYETVSGNSTSKTI